MSTTTADDRTPPAVHARGEMQLYDTLTREKRRLETVRPGHVSIYQCGPTVYKPAHIGHMVGPVIFDALKRFLTYCGYEVTWVVNITDVDDKIIAESRKRGLPADQVAAEMTADYNANLAALGIDLIDQMPTVTGHMQQIIGFIQGLIDKNQAYEADGDVFFDVARCQGYGKLSRRNVEDQQGEGGSAASKKRSPGDFALWKAAKPGEPEWESPWGQGRPGWHIECSAMIRAIFGDEIDIHGGGMDLIFPHHENELAQSESLCGCRMVRYWMHNGLVQAADQAGKVGGRATRDLTAEQQALEKLSKSTGAMPFAELRQRHAPETIRFLLLGTHYRSPIYFSEEKLEETRTSLETFYRLFERYERLTGESFYDVPHVRRRNDGDGDAKGELRSAVASIRQNYLEKLDDDFNTGAAIGELFELVRRLNRFIDQHDLETQPDKPKLEQLKQAVAVLRELCSVLNLFQQPQETAAGGNDELTGKLLDLLVELRKEARAAKNFALGDQIRDRLKELNVSLEDRKDGTLWRIE